MPLKFEPNRRYRMPIVFGPSISPRQGPNGRRYDYSNAPKTAVNIHFATDSEKLEALLPPGFRLYGKPIVTVEITYLTELEWLAGRGYNTLGVKFMVEYGGKKDRAVGPFLAVLFENMAEPIITGREELGFAKLFCEIPEPKVIDGTYHYCAKWDGHEFMRLSLADLKDAEPVPPAHKSDGTLHYRYVPKIGAVGESECEHAVLTPFGGMTLKTDRFQSATGTIEFVESTWEQLPTMHNLVNTLASLPVIQILGASRAMQRGAKELSDQKPLW